MSIRQIVKPLLLRVPSVRRYVEANRAVAVALEQAEAERHRLSSEVEELHAAALEQQQSRTAVEGQLHALLAERNQLQKDAAVRERLARRNIEQDATAIAERVRRHSVGAELAHKDIILTITAGRSGTRLLAVLLSEVLGVEAHHEPKPRATFWIRPTLQNPVHGIDWLIREKFPAIAAAPNRIYVETSHFLCKGMVEPMLMLGLRPRFIILRRNAREIARSYFRLNVVPGRNEEGQLVLTSPFDAYSLPLPNWQDYSDYQLCYWYAKDIERRQTAYLSFFKKNEISHIEVDMQDLLHWESFLKVCHFVDPSATERELSQTRFNEIISSNQNTREMAHPGGHVDRSLPPDVEEQERQIELACAAFDVSIACNLQVRDPDESQGARK